MPAHFPRAHYALLASRLRPGLDGGFGIAVLARARHMGAAGAAPAILTVDPGSAADHAADRRAFVAAGAAASEDVFRNLFDEASEPWLYDTAVPGTATPGIAYRTVADAAGRAVVELPVIDSPDWHRTTANVVVHGDDGDRVLAGFGALYRAWLDHVVAGWRADGLPVVLICESRQQGELLAGWKRPSGVCLIHTVHTSHRPPAVATGQLWQRWFDAAGAFDTVLWPTRQQLDDAVADHGPHPGYEVVPNALPTAVGAVAPPVPGRVVAVGRLAPGKRFDHLLAAWPRVRAAVPGAHLDLYGDGPLRAELERIVAAEGIADSVTLHGHLDQAASVFATAWLAVQTTAYEGQGLVAIEAMARGCPVVSYEVRYGPRDLLADGAGVLVPDGDVAALADAMIRLLRDAPWRARLSERARVRAADYAPEAVMAGLADAVRRAIDRACADG